MKIYPLGENALTIDFGNIISIELNEKVLAIQSLLDKKRFRGLIETVVAYSSLTVFYDVAAVKSRYQPATVFQFVKNYVQNILSDISICKTKLNRVITIPMIVNSETAPDLEFVASHANVAIDEVISLFTQQQYRVFMIGFLPAFAYMGEVDSKIATPRRESPRQKVPKGSIGIAGQQTGIYPFESPGGWQIIGKTNIEMFTPNAESPSFLQSGDIVQFVLES
jgi:inhibitor of KinA